VSDLALQSSVEDHSSRNITQKGCEAPGLTQATHSLACGVFMWSIKLNK